MFLGAGQLTEIGSIGGLFTVVCLLIWRLTRQGAEQENRLLKPAYNRIDALEARMVALEIEQEKCQRNLAHAWFTLRLHGIEVEDLA